MKKFLVISGFIFLGIIFICMVYGEKVQHVKNQDPKVIQKKMNSTPAYKPDINFGKIPLYFISNRGQVNKQAKFYAKASRYTLWLTKEGLVFDSTKRKQNPKQNPKFKTQNSKLKTKIQRDVSRLMFIGVNKNPEIIALNQTKHKVNYFKGNDPSKWFGDIPTSQAILYKNLYKNIDLKVYGIEKQIEYDWIVKPGGNPEDIKVEYKNVKKTHIDKEGNLVIKTKFGELMHKKPVSYQILGDRPGAIGGGETQEVNVIFKKISKNIYGFEVGQYDKSQELIIDPIVLVYSTYLGGSYADSGLDIAVDDNGNTYVTGYTYSTNFPSLNQYMSDPGDTNYDAFVTKLDTTQSGTASLLYSTYMGGNASDTGMSIAVDSSGYAYVTGYTSSTDFPTLNQYQGYQSGWDAFFFKLDTTQSGTASLLYSTYLGGDGLDWGTDVAVDSIGKAYVTGLTKSTDFPALNQYMSDPADNNDDAFVTKLDTTQSGSSSLLYSTYMGGGHSDKSWGITIDSSSCAYVAGITSSTDFPTLNQYQGNQSTCDAFVFKLDTTQSGTASLLYSTYLGGGGIDFGRGITIDSSGYAYVTGYTDSTDFPTLNQYMSDPGDDDNDVFVTKLDTTQSGVSCLLYSTYLGGGSNDSSQSIAIDSSSYVYVIGLTESTDFPTFNQYMRDPGDGYKDVFITKLDTTQSGSSCLLYSTYLGGDNDELGFGIAVDSVGHAYVAGLTYSTDFPTLNQYQAYQGSSGAFVTKLILATLKVTSPNGGENWYLGTNQNITWDATGLSNPLLIILQQNGVNVALINKNIDPSLGTYSWKVGDYRLGAVVANTNCKILLKHKDSTLKDKSNAVFTIVDPFVTVTSPNGGEDWQIGTGEYITWDSAGLTGTLHIILQQHGINVALIQKNINPALGAYTWTVGDCRIGSVAAGSSYKIVIKEKGSTIKDKSDATFSISE